MTKINNYNNFLFENYIEMTEYFSNDFIDTIKTLDILESIVTNSTDLLKSINAEEVDFYKTFELSPNGFKNHTEIENIFDDENFNTILKKLKLKKSNIENNDDNETFIKDSISIKFFSIHKDDLSELDKPEYIIFQSKKKTDSKWDNIKAYKVNEDMRKFYDKLTNKTIEIKKGDKNYIYNTSNSGNDWLRSKNEDDTDPIFKDMLSNDDIKAILMSKDVSITIIT